jgi:uncharacterized protein YfbU (UPF0304 family)
MHLSDGEKLILFMLADMYRKLEIKDGIDPKFIEEAISSGHMWAVKWKYPGIFSATETCESIREEAANLVEMWDTLEYSYDNLSEDDKKRVDSDAHPFANPVRFRGFSGNDEIEYISVARIMIDYLDRFSRFSKRDLNSHMPSLDAYRRMYARYESLRLSLGPGGLSVDSIIVILKEMVHPENRK